MEKRVASLFRSKNSRAFSIVMRTTSGCAEQSWFVRSPSTRANHSGFARLWAGVGGMILDQLWPKNALVEPTLARARRSQTAEPGPPAQMNPPMAAKAGALEREAAGK